ncbi:MAG: LysR substrate-binding domain-containing protein [Xanthobacteraceae bacterium]|nr:LysR substrate-binding domain-containing protein [Xanthobacteraceae bacterium]
MPRQGHGLPLRGRPAHRRLAAGSRRGPIDDALKASGLEREIVTSVGGFSTALALARTSDLIATVPERHTGNLRHGMHSFPLPVAVPEITVSLLWHPRLDADAAHRWLRGCVREVCAEQATNAARRGRAPEG